MNPSQPVQVAENLAASDLKPLSKIAMKRIETLYAGKIKPLVRHSW